jgi:hypothetical protein
MAKASQVAKVSPTAVISMDDNLRHQIANQQKMLSKISTNAKFISFKGGQISIDNKLVPGAKTEVIVLAFMGERTYYPGAFDPDTKQAPICYSYFDAAEDQPQLPHKEAAEKQAVSCDECQWNKFNTATVGKGKACRESIRLALMPAVKDLSKGQVWHARVPITSVPAFKTFAGDVLGAGKPVWAVVVELSVIPDAKTFFKIQWDIKRGITQAEAEVVMVKAVAASAEIAFTYPSPEAEEAPAKPVKGSKAAAKGKAK